MKKTVVAPKAKHSLPSASAEGQTQALPRGKKDLRGQLNDGRPVMAAAMQAFPDDLPGQISYFFSNFRIPASKGRPRAVSVLTTRKYVFAIYAYIDALRSAGIKLSNLGDLTVRHPKIAFARWEEKQLSASTITTYFSCIRRIYDWLGKPIPFKSAKELVKDKSLVVRRMSITKSKAWTENGVDLHTIISKVEALNANAGLYLQLCITFGLRVQEAVALRPLDSHQGSFLEVKLGAKGGRGRVVPYTNSYQIMVIEKAIGMANARTGFIRPADWTINRAMSSFYYYLSKAGVTLKALGVTAHGLRHEFAAQLYEHHSGEPAPVAGGKKIELAVDHSARKHVTEALGHSRRSITSAYLGSIPGMARERRNHLSTLNTQLSAPHSQLTCAFRDLTRDLESWLGGAADVRVWVVGVEAGGQHIQNMPLLMCAGVFQPNGLKSPVLLTDAQLRTLGEAAGSDTQRRCTFEEEARIGHKEDRFEVMLCLEAAANTPET